MTRKQKSAETRRRIEKATQLVSQGVSLIKALRQCGTTYGSWEKYGKKTQHNAQEVVANDAASAPLEVVVFYGHEPVIFRGRPEMVAAAAKAFLA